MSRFPADRSFNLFFSIPRWGKMTGSNPFFLTRFRPVQRPMKRPLFSRWALTAGLFLSLFPGALSSQAVLKDLEFAKVGGVSLKLDLYLPSARLGPAPLVVWIHGGGWYAGGKAEARFGAPSLVLRGIAVASIEYRLSTQAKFPAQIMDCKGAVRWLRAHAKKYNLDPARFASLGPSAGGHLSALLGTTAGVARLEGTVGGNLNQSSAVMAVVDFYGPTDFFQMGGFHNSAGSPESVLIGKPIGEILANLKNPAYAKWVALVRDADPITQVDRSDPPFYIAHGIDDPLVPYTQSTLLQAALKKAGVPVSLRLVPLAGHGLPSSEVDKAYDFLESMLRPGSAFVPFGWGCFGSAGIPVLKVTPGLLPALGKVFQACLTNVPASGAPFMVMGDSSSFWAGMPLPLSLDSLGMRGCYLYTDINAIVPLKVKSGQAFFTATVPRSPVLVGSRFFIQGLLVDPGSVGGVTMSNAALGVVGR